MPSRDLTVNIRGNAGDFDRASKSAAASAKVFQRAIKEQEDQLRRQHEAMSTVGRGLVTFGAGVGVALGLATKAAIDWETAWAGVTKTVDGSAPQMAALEEGLRNLARELPATHEEIAAVAEAAGQLGIKRENIIEFTRSMINLGETTNLSAEEAATALARFANVMGTSQDEVDNLGSALVALGNNSATTEAEILEMAQRLAGAGNQIDLTEGQVLGFAAALSSVGINAEAGGSAFSRVMITMEEAARSGGEELEGFARVAGMSASEFQQAYEQDAAGAIAAFIQGLGRMQQSGQNVFGVLDQLGLSEIRVRDALLRAAGASDLFTGSLELGTSALEANSALAEEAGKRYDSTASQLQIARNNLNDFAITIGETFLPMVGAAADKLGGLVDFLSSLPKPVQQGAAVLGSLAGAASLVGGAALIAVPKIHEFRSVLEAAGGRSAALNRRLGTFGRYLAGPLGLALAGATVAVGVYADKKADAAAATRDFTAAVEADSGALEENTTRAVNQRLEQEGLFELADKLGVSYRDLTNYVLNNGDAQERLNARLGESREGFITLIPGMDNAIVTMDDLLGTFGAGQGVMSQNAENAMRLKVRLDSLSGSMGDAVGAAQRKKSADEQAGVAAEGHAGSLDALAGEMGETETAAETLRTDLEGLTGAQISVTESEIRWREQLKRLTESLIANGGTVDLNTEAGRKNMSQLIDTIKSSHDFQVALAGQTDSTDEATEAGERHRRKLIDMLVQSGLNREEAARLVGSLLAVGQEADRTGEALDNIPPVKRVVVSARGTYDFARKALNDPNTYAAGGVLPGYTPGRDVHDYYAADGMSSLHLSGGEAIMRPEWTRAVGPQYVHAANAAARSGGVEGVRRFVGGERRFAAGGIYDWTPDAIAAAEHDVSHRAARDLARRYKEMGGGPLGGAGGPGGWRWQMAVLRQVFPGLALISGYRPGAITATGNRSYHSLGRAVDIPPRMDVFNWIRGTYGRNTPELIFSPANNRQVWNGRPHYYSGITRSNHWDHIHWAYDKGGILHPGWTMAFNGTGQRERVFGPRDSRNIEQLIEVLSTRWGSLSQLVGSSQAGGQVVHAAQAAATKQVNVMPGATVQVSQPVDVDLLSQRLGFAASTASF